VGEEAVDIELVIDDKSARSPAGPAQEKVHEPIIVSCLRSMSGADVDRHVVALPADQSIYRAPHLGGAHRGDAALGLARGVEREIGAAMGQVLDGAYRVVRARIDGFPRRRIPFARESRSGLTSRAMTAGRPSLLRAGLPTARPAPWPKSAIVSLPEMLRPAQARHRRCPFHRRSPLRR